jgi:hypothetical protein
MIFGAIKRKDKSQSYKTGLRCGEALSKVSTSHRDSLAGGVADYLNTLK